MVDIIFLTLVNRQWSYLSTRGVGLVQMRNFLAAKIYSLVVESSWDSVQDLQVQE